MNRASQVARRHRDRRVGRFSFRPGAEVLEIRSLLTTGIPPGFIGPTLPHLLHSPSAATMGRTSSSPSGVVPVGTVYSNYDAPSLADALGNQVMVIDSSNPITYTTDVGQFEEVVPDESGVLGPLSSSVTLSDTTPSTSDVLLIIPPDYQGTIHITETSSDGTQTVSVPVVTYDDGSYEATIQDLKSVGSVGGPVALTTLPGSMGTTAQPAAQTGVKAGIDWSTLTLSGRTSGVTSTAANGKQYTETGNIWTVKTVKGNTVTLFEADPLNQQPLATQKLVQDPSSNCHGTSFGATGIVDSKGNTHSFQIVQDQDVKTIVADAYTQITAAQSVQAHLAGKTLVFVFYDQGGQAVHSAVNGPSQDHYTTSNGTKLGPSTVVSSKNGDENAEPNTTIRALMSTYPKTTVKIYILAQ